MDSPKENSLMEISLTILSVKLTVKFPCKMSLQHDGKFLSPEVTANSNLFSFNQQVKVKANTEDEEVQINVYLSTEKGGNILAGIIALLPNQAKQSQNQKLTINLKKCLDAAAECQLQVNRVWVKKQRLEQFARSTIGSGIEKLENRKAKMRSFHEVGQTKSELQGNLVRRKPDTRFGSPLDIYRYNAEKTQRVEDLRERIAPKISIYNEDRIEEDLKETKTVGGGRYRKEKPSLKKPIVSETENNLKLDNMKYKMKNEELEKGLNEKNKVIKQHKEQILSLQKKLLERQYIQEELYSKETSIKILEDRLANLTSENSSLRESLADQQKTINQMKDNIRFDILKNKEEYEKKEQAIRHDLALSKSKISELELDISNKQAQLAKAKKYIEDLENSSEQKIFEHDQIIQEMKKVNSKKMAELEAKSEDLEQKIHEYSKDLSVQINENGHLTASLNKKQHQCQAQQIQIHTLESEKIQFLAIKSDYQTLLKKHSKLEQTSKEEQRQSQKNMGMKNKEIGDLQEESTKQISSLENKLGIANQKIKQLKKRQSELENSLFVGKNEEEKLKKSIDRLQKLVCTLNEKIETLEKEIKGYESKVQLQEKENQQKFNSAIHTESLFKMEIQHNKQTISRLTCEFQQAESKQIANREQVEALRTEKTKLENKVQLLEDNNNRTNEYLKEKKEEYEGKENQSKQLIKSLNEKIKQLQEVDKSKQKELNNWEIKELSYQNTIDKLNKQIQQTESKVEKLEKGNLPKLQNEKLLLIEEKNKLKEKLTEALDENKFVANERAKLQSETNKNTKINSVLNEEKISALNEINKLKNALAKADKKEEALVNEIKNLSEENKKQIHRNEIIQKESQKNKETVSELLNNMINMSNRKLRQSSALDASRRKSSFENLFTNDISQVPDHFDIRRMSEIIDTNNRQQQNIISGLEETIKQYKNTVTQLQSEINEVSEMAKLENERDAEAIEKLSEDLENAHKKMILNSNDYEDKITKLQTEINKKEKDLRLKQQTIKDLKYEIEAQKKKKQIILTDNENSENRLLNQIEELSAELHESSEMVTNLEHFKRELQEKIYMLENDISVNLEDINKKDKYIYQINDKFFKLKEQNEKLYYSKKQLVEESLSLKEELAASKEDNLKTKQLLKEEEETKLKLQQFANEVIKQKETLVKAEIQLSGKVIEYEGKVLDNSRVIQSLEEQVKEKENDCLHLKGQNKELSQNIKTFENQLGEQRNKGSQLGMKIQEKEKKLFQREGQIKELSMKYDSLLAKYRKDISEGKEELERETRESSEICGQKDRKINELEETITGLETKVSEQSKAISQNEETIFFEKQKVSLSESTINQLKKENSETELIISKLELEIQNLAEEITGKEEILYEYSGKIYELEQKLEGGKVELTRSLEKLDVDWQNKHDEVCEEYQLRLQNLQKEKLYFNERLLEEEGEKARLLEEIRKIEQVYEESIQNAQRKEREFENEKMLKLNEKNKELDRLKEEISNLNNKINKQKIQYRKKEEQVDIKKQAIQKLQQKIKEDDIKTIQSQKHYQEKLQEYRTKEIVSRNEKEELKGMQWEIQREIKKITQNFIQKLVSISPEIKQKIVQPIRSFEQAMQTAVNFNI